MQLPTWGAEFNVARERAYNSRSQVAVHNYILARAMGFCEHCGHPGVDTIAIIADATDPRSCIALCSGYCSGAARLQEKVVWLEDNLSAGRLLYVTAAIISDTVGAIMVCQKPNSLWEFPGGKVDEGEDLLRCLQREIREELAIDINRLRPFLLVDHDYGKVKLRLYSFTADFDGQAEQIQLYDHISYSFESIEGLSQMALSQADVAIARALVLQEDPKKRS